MPLVLGVAGMAGWGFFEQLVTTKPMVRLRVLDNRTAAVTYFGILIHGMIVSSSGLVKAIYS